MIVSSQVELPNEVQSQLRADAAFGQTFRQFASEWVGSFDQPVAAGAALIAPVLIAFAYAIGGAPAMLETAGVFGFTTAAFLTGMWLAHREDIAWAYEDGLESRRMANADLRHGLGDSHRLELASAPLLVRYDGGLIVLADTRDGRALYFDIAPEDPRWELYARGKLVTSVWRWLRLSGSGSVVEFAAEGANLTASAETALSEAPDAWEAISLALGEPIDGDQIELSFDEARNTVLRLL